MGSASDSADAARSPGTADDQSPSTEPDGPGSFPRRFGDYELIEEIARGGMGVVYRARQLSLNRIVALKMILSGQFASKQEVLRFRGEAEAAANLRHPSIVAIHETGEREGQHFFSMEYVPGRDLGRIVREEGPLPAQRVARYGHIIAGVIHYAHQQGILHRDLKPSNILIDDQDHPRITDFGLAKRIRGEFGLTVTGQVLGSPSFMAPEQAGAKSGALSPASDVYGIGAILYHLLTGRPPFQADTIEGILVQLRESQPLALRLLNPALPLDLETICLKCLEKDPAQRYADAQELAEELERFLRDKPIRARPVSRPEKVWRWCRRKPVLAALIVLVHLVGAAGLAGILWQWRQAVQERLIAQHLLYVANMNLTQAAWEQNHIRRVRKLLAETARSPGPGFEWYYWQRQTHLELMALRDDGGPVLAVAASPDGQRIVTAGTDQTATLWDAATGKRLRILRGHRGPVRSAAFSPDGRRIVTGSFDGTGRVWDMATGEELIQLHGHSDYLLSVAFSPDGQRIVSGSRDQTAIVCDASTGNQLLTLRGHVGPIWSVAFSPDCQRIVTASWDGTAKVWSATNGLELLTFAQHHEPVFSAAFSPDGKQIVSGGFDQTGRIWEAATGLELGLLRGHSGSIVSVVFSPNGRQIATAGDDQTARVWEAGGRHELLAVKRHGSPISSVAFSPDSQRILTAGGSVVYSPDGVEQIHPGSSGDQTVRIWGVSNESDPLILIGHSDRVLSVAFAPDGERIVTGSSDQTARIWNVATGKELGALNGHRGAVRAVAFSPDGRRIVTGSWDKTVKVWDAARFQLLFTLEGHSALLMSAAVSPDGLRMVTGDQAGFAKVWNAASGEELLTLKGPGWIWSVAFSPEGQWILTSNDGEDRDATVWDAASGKERLHLKGHRSWVMSAAFSHDGRRIVTAGDDQSAKVWDATTGACLLTLEGHGDQIPSVTFSPDDQRIVTGSRDQTARVWDAATGKELLTLKGHHGWIFSVAFSPDGHRLVTGSSDRTARIWASASAEQVRTWHDQEKAFAKSRAAGIGSAQPAATDAVGIVERGAADRDVTLK